ncbi:MULTISPECIES: hypothetical protein [Metabacillus]|nr:MULTISPECIES: hypothetical protein [Metabacillus]
MNKSVGILSIATKKIEGNIIGFVNYRECNFSIKEAKYFGVTAE